MLSRLPQVIVNQWPDFGPNRPRDARRSINRRAISNGCLTVLTARAFSRSNRALERLCHLGRWQGVLRCIVRQRIEYLALEHFECSGVPLSECNKLSDVTCDRSKMLSVEIVVYHGTLHHCVICSRSGVMRMVDNDVGSLLREAAATLFCTAKGVYKVVVFITPGAGGQTFKPNVVGVFSVEGIAILGRAYGAYPRIATVCGATKDDTLCFLLGHIDQMRQFLSIVPNMELGPAKSTSSARANVNVNIRELLLLSVLLQANDAGIPISRCTEAAQHGCQRIPLR